MKDAMNNQSLLGEAMGPEENEGYGTPGEMLGDAVLSFIYDPERTDAIMQAIESATDPVIGIATVAYMPLFQVKDMIEQQSGPISAEEMYGEDGPVFRVVDALFEMVETAGLLTGDEEGTLIGVIKKIAEMDRDSDQPAQQEQMPQEQPQMAPGPQMQPDPMQGMGQPEMQPQGLLGGM